MGFMSEPSSVGHLIVFNPKLPMFRLVTPYDVSYDL